MRFHAFARPLSVLFAAALSWAAVSPGDDFFAYANSEWLAATPLPAGRERWGTRDELEALASRRLATLIDEAAAAPAGSAARKIADFRSAYMNERAIEASGLAPLKPVFDQISQISNRAALTRFLAHDIRADVDPMGFGVYDSAGVLGLAVQQSIHGEKTNTAFLLQGGLGLPDRDDYLSAGAKEKALRDRYRDHIQKMLTLAGFSGDERASDVIAIETANAQSHATAEASSRDHNADNIWKRDDFSRRAPGLDWTLFFDEAGLGEERELAVWQPSAVTGLASEVATRPIAAWQNYLRFHAISDVADVLPRAFADEALAFRRATSAAPPASTRAERALAATQLAMRDALGRLYAERYFPAAQKQRVERIGENVRAALLKRVGEATWMSAATKAVALSKLHDVYVGIGYPDHWAGDAAMAVDPAAPLSNLKRVADRDYRRALARLGRPVDLKYWHIAPQTVGAILVFQQNSYVMSAALLEAPKYDHASSDAAAYGSVGSLIGHDLTHYIDQLGADYDTEHRLRRWWTPEDLQGFQQLARPLADQFSAYQPLPGLAINGPLTLSENIADLGGLAAAFDAYRLTLGARAGDSNHVKEQDREFFLAYARTQRRQISDDAMRKQIATNDHAPENFRAATVRNIDAWYAAFDVRPGARLYLEPSARVRIW